MHEFPCKTATARLHGGYKFQPLPCPAPAPAAPARPAAPWHGSEGERGAPSAGGWVKPWENREKTMGKGWFFMGFMGFLASG